MVTRDLRKLAFHFPRLVQGGVEKMRLTLARELVSRGIEVDLVLFDCEGPLAEQVPAGVNVVDLGVRRTLLSLPALTWYLSSRDRPDAMISSLGHQNILSILAGQLSRTSTNILVTQHNAMSVELEAENSWQHRVLPSLYRRILPWAKGVIAVSNGVAQDMARLSHFPVDDIEVLYNPAYPENLKESLAEPIDDYDFSLGPVIVSSGRLSYQKGFDILLEAFAQVLSKSPARLLIIGDGPQRQELAERTSQLGIADAVTLLGFRANPLKYVARSQVFAMSSRYEGFGNVLVEALACKVSIVSTNCKYGPAEILNNGQFGTLVEPENAAALATGMLSALTQSLDKESLHQRALDFHVSAVTDRYLDYVRRCLNR